jgi:large subunit ribosomal protein L35
MNKVKSHKASLKRFKVTANGRLKRSQAGKKHLNSPKASKRKRQLRRPLVSDTKIAKNYVKIFSSGA